MSKSILIKAAVASVLPLVFAANSFAYTTQDFTPEANKASYWGTSCVKYENIDTPTYTAPAGATKVIIKGGTLNAIYTDGSFENLTAATNPNSGKPYGISHVIVCAGEVETDTDTEEVPTTPVTPVTPDKPVTPKPEKDKEVKEDKNQSKCNPSDTNSANPKHHDDGIACEEEKTPVDNGGQGGGHISDEAAQTTRGNVQGVAAERPSVLPSTGLGFSGLLTALGAGTAAYVLSLRRK